MLAHIALRSGDKQRHPDAALERLCFLEHQVVAQHLAVVGHEQNYGIIHDLLLHQCGD